MKFIKFILPIVIIFYSFSYGVYIGLTLAAAYAALVLLLFRTDIYTFLATFNYSRGKREKSLKMFKKLYKSKKLKLDTKLTYAYILLKEGNPDESLTVIKDLEKSGIPSDKEMVLKSTEALVIWKQGDLDGAIDLLYEIFQNEKSTTIYGSLGWLLILKGDMEKALEFNLEAYEYNNKNHVILDNLGQTYYMIGNIDKASEIYKSLVDAKPYFPEAYYNFGLVLEAKGDKEKALENYNKAINMTFTYLSTVEKAEVQEKINSLQ